MLLRQNDISRSDMVASIRQLMKANNGSSILNRLFELPWFNRLWVVQEIVAARDILLICGSCQLEYNYLKGTVWNSLIYSHSGLSEQAAKGFYDFRNLTFIRAQQQEAIRDFSCSETIVLLAMTRNCICTDKRDFLFALGWTIKDPDELPYSANYRKDVATVYTEFAIHQFKRSPNLTMLAYCGIGKVKINGMASWVPDWSGASNPIFARYPSVTKRALYAANGNQYRARQDERFYQGSQGYPVWILSGVIVDKIETIWSGSRDYVNSSQLLSSEANIVGNLLELLLMFLTSCSIHAIPWAMLWRTLLCDRSLVEDGRPFQGSLSFSDELSFRICLVV